MKRKSLMIALSLLVILCISVSANALTVIDIDATQSTRDNEQAEQLFDSDLSTKWCVSRTGLRRYSLQFSLVEEITIKGFYIATANDNYTYANRNPEYITIYGSNNDKRPTEEKEWIPVLSRSKINLENENRICYWFNLDNIQYPFRHYKVLFEKENGYTMQISEFGIYENSIDTIELTNLADLRELKINSTVDYLTVTGTKWKTSLTYTVIFFLCVLLIECLRRFLFKKKN